MATKKNITVTVNLNTEKQGLEIRFNEKPCKAVIDGLKEMNFKYYASLDKAWIRKVDKVNKEALANWCDLVEAKGYKTKTTQDGKTYKEPKAAKTESKPKAKTNKAKANKEPKAEPEKPVLEAKAKTNIKGNKRTQEVVLMVNGRAVR